MQRKNVTGFKLLNPPTLKALPLKRKTELESDPSGRDRWLHPEAAEVETTAAEAR